MFDVGLFEDKAELGSESEFGQDLQDIPIPTAVIEPPRQASVELIDFGIYHAQTMMLTLTITSTSIKYPLPKMRFQQMNTCEEHDTCKFAPIVRFSFDVGTLTGPPTANELEDIVIAGHVPHPNQFPCNVTGEQFPTSVLNISKMVKQIVEVGSFLVYKGRDLLFSMTLFP